MISVCVRKLIEERDKVHKRIPYYLTSSFYWKAWTIFVLQILFVLRAVTEPSKSLRYARDIRLLFVSYEYFSREEPTISLRDFLLIKCACALMYTITMQVALCISYFFYYCIFFRQTHIEEWLQEFEESNSISKDIEEELKTYKEEYAFEYAEIIEEDSARTQALIAEDIAILKELNHANIFKNAQNVYVTNHVYPYDDSIKSLHAVLHSSFSAPKWEYIRVVHYLKDVLKAMEYLHSRNIYHLDLQPTNILIVKNPRRNSVGMAKVTGFHFAKQCESKKVSSIEVGLSEFYRPPEHYNSEEVDAEKFDCWSIGVTALEAFTGGWLSIIDNEVALTISEERVVSFQITNQSNFATAMNFAWNLREKFKSHFYELYLNVPNYDLLELTFISDCWCFIRELVMLFPEERSTVKQALMTSAMRNVIDTT